MINGSVNARPMIPTNYLQSLNGLNTDESGVMMIPNPVCISIEPDSMNIRDVIADIDFQSGRKSRR